jgi:hypothetical protein
MEGRQGEVGRSKRRSEIERIEPATWLNAKVESDHDLGETRAHVRQVFHCERIWRTFADGKAKDGFGRCTQRRRDEMGQGRLEPGPTRSQKAAGAYRKGCELTEVRSRGAQQGHPFGMLEPYDGKLSRTVLRGPGAERPLGLPGAYGREKSR